MATLMHSPVQAPDTSRAAAPAGAPRGRALPSMAARMQSRFGNAGTSALLAGSGADRRQPGSIAGAAQVLYTRGALHPKLAVSDPGDPLEREADEVARQVLSKPAGGGACCSSCGGGAKPVLRRAAIGSAPSLSGGAERQARQLTQGGEPLPLGVRGYMEPRFGADFSDVRIHRDANAAESAKGLNARAWTLGNHIAFGSGQWRPGTPAGDYLIAHELTHTLHGGGTAQAAPIHRIPFGADESMFGTPAGGHPAAHVVQGAGAGSAFAEVPTLYRQTLLPNLPDGRDPCFDLLEAIIAMLNEVAKRFNDAVNDPHELYRYFRNDPHPDYGSWEGHRDRYNYDRDRLRRNLAEWESNDECRGLRLSPQQQEEMAEAKEFASKLFPAKPAPAMREAAEEKGPSVWDKLRQYLPEIVVGALIGIATVGLAALLVACFGSGACEFALAVAGLGLVLASAVTAALRSAGVQDTSGGPVASASDGPEDDDSRQSDA